MPLDYSNMAKFLMSPVVQVADKENPLSKGINPYGLTEGARPYAGGANPAKPGQSRADAGGNTGVNGYLYKGGQFLPSTEAPPGTWRVKVNGKASNIPNGQEMIEPGKLVGRPTPFSRSVYSVMGAGSHVNIDNGKASVNPRFNFDYAGYTPTDKSPIRFKNLAQSPEHYSINDLVDLYNKGVRWIDTEPLPGVEIIDKK